MAKTEKIKMEMVNLRFWCGFCGDVKHKSGLWSDGVSIMKPSVKCDRCGNMLKVI